MPGPDDIVEQSLVEEDEETKAEKEKSSKDTKTSKSTRVTKILLLLINVITFIIGFILLVVGCVYYANHESYEETWEIGSSFCSASIFCIVIGLIICLVSFLGFYGALRENNCCLLAFCILISITVFLEMILAVTFFAAITANNVGSFFTNIMKDSMKRYDEKHKDHGVTKAWNLIQTELKCCGITKADDWHADAGSIHQWSTSNALPESCCASLAYDVGADGKKSASECKLSSEDVYKVGCLTRLKEEIKTNGGAIGGVIIVFVLFQIGLIVAAFHLKKKVGNPPTKCPPFY